MRYTKEQRAEKRKERLALLDQAVEQLTSSEAWEAWLKVRRSFHAYSWRNQLMIAVQRPDTIAVKGFHAWKDLNRVVKKGAQAIWILAPAPFKTGELDDDGNPIRKMWFKPVPVFAYEDTDQIEGLPEIPIEPPLHDVEGDNLDAELGRLQEWLEAAGVTVEYRPIAGAGKGWFRPPSDICIDLMPINAQLKTLIHEACHWLRHQGQLLDYATEEVIVESTAYAVCATLGLETAGYSAGYVASWGEDKPKPDELVQIVDELATQIEEVVLAETDRRRGAEPQGDAQAPRGRSTVPPSERATLRDAA